ncbi:interferon-induced very large GTPase 1-like isoform X2 [Mercenaria mercenaria]|uniref:interferon-induced very large GTPase 1-like isoform X2 n=1 Tax=Mercenaria mercenaria TaxID=6596 RepID=UPI00234E96D2|nr:interferon-induced very large GTPase 1-like isoform X2 [Mercenaria mercenaria]
MGVDIETYRGRIGTFKFAFGTDVVTVERLINFSQCLKTVGSLAFIGLLLVMAGIESNPGPKDSDDDITMKKGYKIQVVGIPPNVDDAYLTLVFKNPQQQDGGKETRLQLDRETHSAFIEFEEPDEPVCTSPPLAVLEPVVTLSDEPLSSKPLEAKQTPTATISINPPHTEPSTLKSDQAVAVSTELLHTKPIPVEPVPTEPSTNRALHTERNETMSISKPEAVEHIPVESVSTEQIPAEQVSAVPQHIEPTSTEHKFGEQLPTETVPTEILTTEDQLTKSKSETVTAKVFTDELIRESEGEETEEVTISNIGEQAEIEEPHQFEMDRNLEDSDESGEKDADSCTIHQMLDTLGLTDKYPGKIKVEDVLSISLCENRKDPRKLSEIPYVLLRNIIAVQSKARDMCVSGIEDKEENERNMEGAEEFDFIDETSASNELSPLDVFNVTIQCCDNMLQQLVYKKLYLCKIAVPFVHIDRLSLESKISIWPFRSLVVGSISGNQKESKSYETELLELPVKTVTLARFGRTKFSKSKLVNNLISDQIHDTFFNGDCPSGLAHRFFSNGTIELFFLPAVGNKNDSFSEAFSFFNMRGNIETDFHDDVITLISDMTDTLVLVIDKESLVKKASSLKKVISHFPSVVLVLDNPLKSQDKVKLKNFKDDSKIPLTPVGTHKGRESKNLKEIVANVKVAVLSSTKTSVSKSLESRLNAIATNLRIDETDKECANGKLIASTIFKQMSDIEDKCKWKEIVIPSNYIYSQKLGVSVKRLYRLKNVEEIGNVEDEIYSARAKQLENVSEPMKLFINAVTDNGQNPATLQYIFGWLSYFLERQKRDLLPRLIEENRICWKNLEILKKQGQSHSELEMKRQIQLTEASQKRIEDASLGIEHLFREAGHIYEALMAIDKSLHPTDLHIPSTNIIVEAVANLVVHGQPFELVDGDNFYMPTRWVHAVLEKVSSKIKQKPVLALSVLGLQSSGKSTLLNAMFGSQFPVKSGRCTRGIHIQLLPCKANVCEQLPFEYILVIDTEGLRAPEINPNRTNHDNELSTVITGLGDVTLLNIMGENTSEIKDIVQVVIHAFLRLKLVRKTADIGKSFYLLHQNVVDISAADNMRTGQQVLMETLDTVTMDAAEAEGITEITTFNQIIEFDMTSNVWFLPNFWQGNPPMARVNFGYSDCLADKKIRLLHTALERKDKSFQTLNDISMRMQDLWKGVLTEDFVFSFRNSLEIKAYFQLEETLKDNLIKLENDVDIERISISQEEFAKCEQQSQLQNAFDEIILHTQKTLAEKESMAKEAMAEFFENNEYKDTVIQWKEFTFNKIRLHCSELENNMKLETVRFREKRAIFIMTAESSKEHEKELYDRSLQVAKETKGKNLTEHEINVKFEETWKNILREIMNVSISSNTQKPMRDFIIKYLFDVIFSTEKMILKTELEEMGIFQLETEKQDTGIFPVTCLSHLKGSFSYTKIQVEDISISNYTPDSENFSITVVEEKIDYLFETLDLYIIRLCQSNAEITQRDVKNALLKTKTEVELIRKGNKEFTLKTTAVVKLFIHVSTFIQTKFDEHNINYQRSHGVQARLEIYKLQVKGHFIAYINDRKTEETAAKQICIVTENILREKIKERLPIAVKSALLNSLTHLKFHLMLEMLEDMTNNNDFDSFIDYIEHPKLFAEKYITKKSEEFLFGSESKKYSELASGMVSECYDNLRESARASMQAFEFESPLMDSWLKCFTSKFSKYTLSVSSFGDIHKVLEKIEDMHNFESVLIEQMNASEANLNKEFEEQTHATVKWSGENPYESLIQKAWGCSEQCAFCGEPCAKDTNHEGSNHYSLQHRLSCCKGVRDTKTRKASITSCNYDVQSEEVHHCNVFNFLCNASKAKECEIVWHKYRDYRTYLPNWDIEPNSNMQDCGKFWLWFVATYKHKLAAHYRYVVSNVPSAWDAITKDEALNNLRRIYTGSN